MFKIMGRQKGMTEELDTTDTRKEAELLKREYIMAFGKGWTVWIREHRG